MTLNPNDKKQAKAVFELYEWQYDNGNNFKCLLFDLIAKADRDNYLRIALGFPIECMLFRAWGQAGDNGNDLFRQFEIGHFTEK